MGVHDVHLRSARLPLRLPEGPHRTGGNPNARGPTSGLLQVFYGLLGSSAADAARFSEVLSTKSFGRLRVPAGVRLILLGPPGSGKGTQAARLSHALGVPRISTGDILRRNVADGTDLGVKAKAYMESGKLVPDDLVISMTAGRLKEPDARKGFILDGFPRTIAQAEALANLTPVDVVINLFLEPEELVKRSAGRRICPKCESVYHVASNAPRKPGICDKCGTALVTRPDDSDEVVRTRIETYERQTAPLIQYYKGRGLLREVYASGLIDEISQRVQEAITA